jgi:hypothetical protein
VGDKVFRVEIAVRMLVSGVDSDGDASKTRTAEISWNSSPFYRVS